MTNAGTNSLTWTLANTSALAQCFAQRRHADARRTRGHGDSEFEFRRQQSGGGDLQRDAVVHESEQRCWSKPPVQPVSDQPADDYERNRPTRRCWTGRQRRSRWVAGGSPLAYQWQDNGNNLTDGGNISGSTTTNLIISSTAAADVGTYTVTVTNVAGSATSSNALLTIIPSAPVIILQPASQTVVVEGIAQFVVSAIGNKPFFYQWSFNGTNLVGATNAALTLTDVQFSQAGTYAVLITNILGSVTSSNATLTVLPCDPAPSNMVAWWRAEGNVLDNVWTNNGSPVGALSYTNGEVGQAFVFDGSTSYILVPASPSLDVGTGSGFTIECWVQPSSAGILAPLVEWDSVSTDGLQLWVNGSLDLAVNIKDTSGVEHKFNTAAGVLSTSELRQGVYV